MNKLNVNGIKYNLPDGRIEITTINRDTIVTLNGVKITNLEDYRQISIIGRIIRFILEKFNVPTSFIFH